jgi:hypothetical protein
MFSHSYAFLDAKKGGFTKKCKRFVKNYNALQPEFGYFAAHSYMYGGTKKRLWRCRLRPACPGLN